MSERTRWTDRLADRALAGALEANADQEGGSMVFGAITLFTLVLFSWLVYVVGMASGDRIQLQNAADSAAYSGALVEAESLESIGFLNDGMAWVYYSGCRYAIDSAVYSTLALFYYHDSWVQQNHSERLSDTTQDHNLEMDVQVLNPATRDKGDPLGGQNMDQPNYVPPPPDDATPTQIEYGWALLGQGGTKIFTSRFQLAQQHALNLLGGDKPRAKEWIQDIHYAERIILAATPTLVAKTCVEVAYANRPVQNQGDGHFFVAVSDDIDRVWRLDGGSDSTANDLAGFSDGANDPNASSGGVSDALAKRYSTQSNPVDNKTVDYPSWFDSTLGKLKTPDAYSQTRICWNKRDWQHESPGQRDHSGGMAAEYQHQSPNQQPSGHWHARHWHLVNSLDPYTGMYDIPAGYIGANFKHDAGHGITSGDDADPYHAIYPDDSGNPLSPDFQIDQTDLAAEADHHMAQTCPTCGNDTAGKQYVSVHHDSKEAVDFFNQAYGSSGGGGSGGTTDVSKWMEFSFGSSSSGGSGSADTIVTPRLILAKAPLFRAGVTVAVWSPSIALGNTFPGSPFGMFAVASAQIGVRTPSDGNGLDTVTVVDDVQGSTVSFTGGRPSSIDLTKNGSGGAQDQPVNFYLGEGDSTTPGARWGARLVPIARRLTWADDSSGSDAVSSGLNKLITGNRWFRTPDDVPDKGAALGDDSMAGKVPDPNSSGQQIGVDQLLTRDYFDPSGQNVAKSIVH